MFCNTNFRKGAFFAVISMFLLTTACRQGSDNNLQNGDDQGGYASDLSRIELVTDDILSIADAAGEVYNDAFIGDCSTVGTDTTNLVPAAYAGPNYPKTLVIRFGGTGINCTCLDGRNRRGAIIVSYKGEYSDTNQIHTITFDNYYINDNQVTGTIKTIRVDTTVTGDWYYKVSVNDSLNMSLDPLKSQFVVWNASLVRKWIAGYAPPSPSSQPTYRNTEIFSISGYGTLTRPSGHVFNCQIATPLQMALGCDYAESGVVNITGYTGGRILNYGTGTCDQYAQLNIGAHVYELTLTK